MKTLFLTLLLLSVAAGSLRAISDGEVEARRVALELAGAFANDGFKLRDGVWQGIFETGKTKVIQVNLYAGNEYWFSAAAAGENKKVAVTVYDETGQPIECEQYQEGVTAAAGFSPGASGPYYVKVDLVEGTPGAYCLVYSYK